MILSDKNMNKIPWKIRIFSYCPRFFSASSPKRIMSLPVFVPKQFGCITNQILGGSDMGLCEIPSSTAWLKSRSRVETPEKLCVNSQFRATP